ncbi:MAG: HAD family hydrolase [Microgenomates group bacterium]
MKAIIFDFGGVIALHKGLYYVPVFPDVEMWHRAENGEISEEEFWKKLEEYYHKSSDEILKMLVAERELNVPLIEFLKEKGKQLKLGFINNGLSRLTEKLIKDWGLGQIFAVMIISSKEKLSKPDPKIFLLACERLGVRPEDCIFIGRKGSYVEVAQSLGMKGFVYEAFSSFKAQISKLFD